MRANVQSAGARAVMEVTEAAAATAVQTAVMVDAQVLGKMYSNDIQLVPK